MLIVSISSRDAALQGRERYLMPQPTSLLLPDVGRGDLMVAISASFPELEDPLDNSWDLRYETSSWYS